MHAPVGNTRARTKLVAPSAQTGKEHVLAGGIEMCLCASACMQPVSKTPCDCQCNTFPLQRAVRRDFSQAGIGKHAWLV